MQRALLFLTCSLATLAFAQPPEDANNQTPSGQKAVALAQAKLLGPLSVKEAGRSRFSRAFIPPVARRVRVLDTEPRHDAADQAFVTFAVDEQRGLAFDDQPETEWHADVIKGCVYLERGEVFVERGHTQFPAGLLLGQKVKANPAACRVAPLASAK